MASEEILRRAQLAMDIEKDLLAAQDEGDADNDGENGEAEGENEAAEGEQTNGDRGENGRNGLWQRLKRLMCPCDAKFNWRLLFNLEASTSADDRKKSARPSNDNEGNPSSSDAVKIKHLREENNRLNKLANKFLEKYEQLNTRLGEMSEVKDQLVGALRNCDELKAELLGLQRTRDSLNAQMSTQSDRHRDEVNRLEAELKTARDAVSKLARDKQSIEAKNAKNEQSLRTVENALQTLTIRRDALELEMSKQTRLHDSEKSQLNALLTRTENEKTEQRRTNDALVREIQTVEHRARIAEEKNMRVKRKIEPVKRKIQSLRQQLPFGGIVAAGDLQYLDDRIVDAANEAH